MVEWHKGWTAAAHTYLVEIGDDTVWLGRLGNGSADWAPVPACRTTRSAERAGAAAAVSPAVSA